MSKEASKLTAVKLESGLTPDQREWLKKLGTFVGASAGRVTDGEDDVAPAGVEQIDARESETVPSTAEKRGLTEGLFDPSDIPGQLLKTLTAPHSCTCRINNKANRTLQMDPASVGEVDDEAKIGISHGKYDSFPPDPVVPNMAGAEFKASSNTVLGQTLTGVTGRVKYVVDDQNTTWTIFFNNPFKGANTADARVEGPNREAVARFSTPKPVAGGGDDAIFLFTLEEKGVSPKPQPGPQPGPTPQEVPSSCLITINNNTNLVLTLADQGHDRGDFMTFPSSSVQPGASTSFASVETPHSKEQGCKGFLVWEVGSPAAAVWRIEWDNPEEAKNTTNTSLDPQTAGFRSLDQIGQGEDNVPVVFTLSGGGQGPSPAPGPGPGPSPGPGPGPGPSPGPEPEFNPPVEQRQPTLRRGDKSKDGWVEYLQELLIHHKIANLEIDGDFGPATEAAVLKFQHREKIQEDRVVGNQTWAALRLGAPEKPSTDGRQPHSFVEEGSEARWSTEEDAATYHTISDRLELIVVSVGDAKIDDFEATVRVTPPNTKSKVVKVTIGKPFREIPSGAGHVHAVTLPNFKKTFPAQDPAAKVADYKLEAFLPQELGGDLWSGKKIIEESD